MAKSGIVRRWPELWFVLSRRLFDIISTQPGRSDGLLRMRLAGGVVRHVDLDGLGAQLHELAVRDTAIVHVVAEQLDVSTIHQLRQLAPPSLDIRLHDWHNSPSNVLMSLSLPDLVIVEALEALDGSKSFMPLISTSAAQSNNLWLHRYRDAMVRWELDARLQHEADFDLVYTAQPLPWAALLSIPALPWWRRMTVALIESLLLLFQLLFASGGAVYTMRTARFRALPATLASGSLRWTTDTHRALAHVFLGWPLLITLAGALALLPFANLLPADTLVWSVFAASLLSIGGAMVCGPVVSILGAGAGGVAMAAGFGVLNVLLSLLAGGLPALTLLAASTDPYVLVVHGVIGSAAALISSQPLAATVIVLAAPGAAIVVTAWLMGRPSPARDLEASGELQRRQVSARKVLVWGLIGSCAGVGIPIIKALTPVFDSLLVNRDQSFVAAAAVVGGVCYAASIWLRTNDRLAAAAYGLAYSCLGALLWSCAVAWRGSLAGLYVAGPATGFFHAGFFTLAYVIGLRFAGRRAAFLAAALEGCIGFVLFNGLLIFGKI